MDYMEKAFTDKSEADLRRVISGWQILMSQDESSPKYVIDDEFKAQVMSWGYWDDLAALPRDTIAINMRDITP